MVYYLVHKWFDRVENLQTEDHTSPHSTHTPRSKNNKIRYNLINYKDQNIMGFRFVNRVKILILKKSCTSI